MISDYVQHFLGYLNKLYDDVYPSPSDPGHTAWCREVISILAPRTLRSVLDVGCGDGFSEMLFRAHGYTTWEGVTIASSEINNKNIKFSDMSFLPYSDNHFDLIFARHVLEHSPMPLITLMEWRRVSKGKALIVLPSPEYWGISGANHYYVLPSANWWWLFECAGWNVVNHMEFKTTNPLFQEYTTPKPYPRPPKVVEDWFLLSKPEVSE